MTKAFRWRPSCRCREHLMYHFIDIILHTDNKLHHSGSNLSTINRNVFYNVTLTENMTFMECQQDGGNRITYWSQGVASLPHKCQSPSPPLDNIRVMVTVWRLRGNIIRTAPCCVVWHNVHSQQHTHVSSSYRSSRLGLSHWDPCGGNCLELCYCNMVEWSWWDSGLVWKTNWFPSVLWHCWMVIWPVKIVPDMTYNVFGGMLNLAQSISQQDIFNRSK